MPLAACSQVLVHREWVTLYTHCLPQLQFIGPLFGELGGVAVQARGNDGESGAVSAIKKWSPLNKLHALIVMYYIGLSGFKLRATISVRLQDQKVRE